MAQPSVSRSVKQLEKQEGMRLLDGGTRGGVHLTPAGRRVYESSMRIFAEIEAMKAGHSSEREECVGALALGASDNVCNHLLPDWCAAFLKQHPRVTLNLFSGTSDSILTELQNGRAELGIFYTRVKQLGFVTVPLLQVEFAVVAPPDKKPWSTPNLIHETYVGSRAADYAGALPGSDDVARARCAALPQSRDQQPGDPEALRDVRAGLLSLPGFMVERELERRELRRVEIDKKLHNHLYLVRREGRTLTRPAEEFRTFCHQMRGALAPSSRRSASGSRQP